MVAPKVINPVHDILVSTVVTSRVSGDDKLCEFTDVDLAMKLHYVKAVYFFGSDVARGLDIYTLKQHMFEWLAQYYPTAGRVRKSEIGRPFIKCNDAGVRIVEAKCRMSIAEWLGLSDRKMDDQLVPSKVLGPELEFSPLIYVQFTWFKCGGLSVGLNWAHILGDSFSAIAFMNKWAQIMAQGKVPRQQLPRHQCTWQIIQNHQKLQKSDSSEPLSLKSIDSVGDTWQIPNGHKTRTHCFHVSEEIFQKAVKHKKFPFVTALFWKIISKIRKEEIKVVTLCSKGLEHKENKIPNNNQVIGIIKAKFNIQDTCLSDLAKLVDEKIVDESSLIENYVAKNSKLSDFILYGANLTFVNLEEANIYGLEIKGERPIFANLTVSGVGEEGVVLVSPEESCGCGRMVTVMLPEKEIIELKNVLREEWGIL